MTDSEGDGDAVHVLDVDSDLGEPLLDSAARSASAAAEMPPHRPPPRSSTASRSPASPSPSISAAASSKTSTSSSSPFVLNDRSVATGGALLVALLLMVIGKRGCVAFNSFGGADP